MKKILIILPLLLFAAISPALSLDKPYDHSLWDQFLKKYVNEQGEIDYASARKDRQNLDDYLSHAAEIPRDDFQTWPREEAMALWINVYNAAVIRSVIDHYPLKSIQAIPGLWDAVSIQVSEKKYSFHDIELRVLLGVYREEKIHAALACGARSCPRLSRDAYTGPKLDGQLYMAATRFVNDPSANQIIPDKGKVRLSKIFYWHAKDFLLNFGKGDTEEDFKALDFAVLSFVSHYLDAPEKVDFLETGKYKVKYLPFDWRLNEAVPPA